MKSFLDTEPKKRTVLFCLLLITAVSAVLGLVACSEQKDYGELFYGRWTLDSISIDGDWTDVGYVQTLTFNEDGTAQLSISVTSYKQMMFGDIYSAVYDFTWDKPDSSAIDPSKDTTVVVDLHFRQAEQHAIDDKRVDLSVFDYFHQMYTTFPLVAYVSLEVDADGSFVKPSWLAVTPTNYKGRIVEAYTR